jgi:hypothetical protein
LFRFSRFLILLIVSCTTSIKPPQEKGKLVALVDHGRHASLIIEGPDQSHYRYAYGDWNFYAEMRTGFFSGARALMWPTQAALGRKVITADFNYRALSDWLPDGVEEMLIFSVDSSKAQKLKEKLDDIFYANIDSKLINNDYGLEFVFHPEGYWMFNNSNQMVGRWMKELGGELSGGAFFSNWKINN